MTQKELNEVLRLHKQWLKSNGNKGKRAALQNADLKGTDMRGTDMRGANLQNADMQNADMQDADMQDADMQGAALQYADLKGANLQYADLKGAYMQGANLQGADLQGAHLQLANLDYSVWPLWCGSFDVKCDIRLASQLAYHFCRLDSENTEIIAAQNALITLANKFHRVEQCGVLKPKPVSKTKAKTKLKTNKVRRKGKVNKV